MTTNRWTFETEAAAAMAIRDAEQRTWEVLDALNIGGVARRQVSPAAQPTRALAVEQLAAAVRVVHEAAAHRPELREASARATAAWLVAEELTWALAMSGRRIARGEARKLATAQLEEEDLVQEGYIGLVRAARRFDPERGLRFSTYARWWVRAQMTRAKEITGQLVRLPGGAAEQLRQLHKTAHKLGAAHARADISTLARTVGLEEQRVGLLLAQGPVVYLEQPDEEGISLLDHMTPEDGALSWPDATLSHRQGLARLRTGLDHVLSGSERFVLVKHFGLEGERSLTMAEIGQEIGQSRERTRKLELSAMRRLKPLVGA